MTFPRSTHTSLQSLGEIGMLKEFVPPMPTTPPMPSARGAAAYVAAELERRGLKFMTAGITGTWGYTICELGPPVAQDDGAKGSA